MRQGGNNHNYGMQQGFSMAHNGHPNMSGLGVGGHHLMNLNADMQQEFSFKDLANKAKASVNKLINKTELDAHKAANKSVAQKNLDQLVYDYGMENEYAAIDMNRPVPFNGMGSYGSGAGYAGEWPFATEEFVGRDYYGAPGAFGAAAPAFIW